MGKSSLCLLLLLASCAELAPDQDSLEESASLAGRSAALSTLGYRCEAMSQAARLVAPPPPPSFNRDAVVPLARAACPEGQVPFYAEPEHEAPASPPPSFKGEPGGPSTQAGTYWYASLMKATESFNNAGVGGRIYFSNPAVYDQYDMVTAEMSIVSGANYHLVEIGLRKFWDAFPRLMISQWAYGTFNDAAGFVRVHGTYAPGMPLTPYYGLAIQHYVRYDAGNWWIWFNDGWVGYFPGSIWANTFTSGNMAHFYGEVFSAASRVPPITDMGNGLFASSASAAYMQDICMHAAVPTCYLVVNATTYVSSSAYYSLNYAGGSFMRFGGTGGL
jgi:hypothetical protein